MSHRPAGLDLDTPGVVFQGHEKKQRDNLPMLGHWPGRFVAAHHVARFLTRYRVGQERDGIRQLTVGMVAPAGEAQLIPVDRG